MSGLLERMAKIVDLIGETSFAYMDEYDLQTGIHAALVEAEIPATREVRLTDGRSRADVWSAAGFPVPAGAREHGICLEVKIQGSGAEVRRQLTRYANCVEVDGIILVTTRAKHHHIPTVLNGKPVRLVSLIGAGL